MVSGSYYNLIYQEIKNLLSVDQSKTITYDLLDDDFDTKTIVLKHKQKMMKIGQIWQLVVANYPGFTELNSKFGLDVISYERKMIIEIKNRTNTDNWSSKNYNFEKLYKFKKDNPDFTCIYANINDKTYEKTITGKIKVIKYKDIEIYQYIGMKFFELIFDKDKENIITFVKQVIKNC